MVVKKKQIEGRKKIKMENSSLQLGQTMRKVTRVKITKTQLMLMMKIAVEKRKRRSKK